MRNRLLPRRRGRHLGSLLVALVLVAACSSSGSSDRAEGGPDSDGGSLGAAVSDQTVTPGQAPGSVTEEGVADGPAQPGGAAAPSQGAESAGQGASSPGAAAPRASGGAAPAPAAAGGELKVGLFYGRALQSVPGLGVGTADGLAMAQAIVDWINTKGGGAGGRKLKLVGYGALPTDSGPTADEAACVKFTQDEPVPIVMVAYPADTNFYECMAKRGVSVFNGDVQQARSHEFHVRRDIYSVAATPDRTGATLADALARQRYFADAGMTLGVLHSDEPRVQPAVSRFVERAAAAAGVKPKTVIATDGSQGSLQNAVIRFRSDGVTHVALFEAGAFPSQAAAQAYFPRYALTSAESPNVIAINTPPEAFRGTVGVGYIPTLDVNESEEPPLNESMKRCRQIVRDSGQDSDVRFIQFQMQVTCGALFYLKAALDRASAVNAAAIRDAVHRIGGDWVPPLTFSARLGPNRNDAADTYRNLAYDTGCRCFRYRGDLTRMSLLPGQS